MKCVFAFALLIGLSACNRHGVADVTLDAAAAQRNATATKTLADLEAANQAAQGPASAVHDARPTIVTSKAADAAPVENAAEMPEADISDDADTNG